MESNKCRLDHCVRLRCGTKGSRLCEAHYKRRHLGRPDWDAKLRGQRTVRPRCRLDGCERIAKDDGLCWTHLRRSKDGLANWGDPCEAAMGAGRTTLVNSYGAAHQRVRQARGPASGYRCVECGGEARDWSYDGTDPAQEFGPRPARSRERPEESRHFYSLDPNFYKPMCKKCHMQMDGAKASQELYEYRLWKHKTGRTLANFCEDGIDQVDYELVGSSG